MIGLYQLCARTEEFELLGEDEAPGLERSHGGSAKVLTALVAAFDTEGGALRAAMPLAGAALLEHQIRRLAAAGAEHPILLVEAMTPALAAPLARLRADGIAVRVLTHISEAADLLAAEPRVLVVADACLPARALLERMATAPVPAVATVPDMAENAAFERIDATERWAGIALLDGRRIAEVAQIVGDWDPISTMLRSAVQEHAGRVPAGDDVPVVVGSGEAMRAAEARLVAGSREEARGWAQRYVEAPIAEVILPQLFARAVQPSLFAGLSGGLAAAGAVAGLAGYRWWALAPLLLAGPLARIAGRLSLIQARKVPAAAALPYARRICLALAAGGLGAELMLERGQWGWLLLGCLTVIATMLTSVGNRLSAWLGSGGEPMWLATPAALTWSLLPFALLGAWGSGLVAVTIYAAGSATFMLGRALKLAR